jgi:hypothetical protein
MEITQTTLLRLMEINETNVVVGRRLDNISREGNCEKRVTNENRPGK